MPSMNALFVIAPYKYEGLWVFDDPAVGLSKESFIAGIDTMIDRMVADIPNAERGFRAIFSATRFPGWQSKLEWRREDGRFLRSHGFSMQNSATGRKRNAFGLTVFVLVE